MIAAGTVTAVVLILIGVLIGSATASGGTSSPSTTPTPHPVRQTAELRAARQTIAGLRTQLALASHRVSTISTRLSAARARVRCWRTAALHHAAPRVSKCAART